MNTQQFKTAFTPAGENAYNNPYLKVLDMKVEVKITHTQTYSQFSAFKIFLLYQKAGVY